MEAEAQEVLENEPQDCAPRRLGVLQRIVIADDHTIMREGLRALLDLLLRRLVRHVVARKHLDVLASECREQQIVLFLDIRRHWLAYWGFVAWSRAFTGNRLVRHDGPLSVLRGFSAEELLDLGRLHPEFDWTVRAYAGFQLALVGRRREGP